MHLRRGAFTLAIVVAVFVTASAARAGEPSPAQAVLDAIKAAEKDPERKGLSEAIDRIPDVHNGLDDAGLRKKLQAAAGKVLKDKKAGAARSAAAAVLGKLDDPKGAWKQLGKALPTAKSKQAQPSELEAVRATALLAPEGAIAPLLKLMEKGKSMDAAREAITALAVYGNSKKREAILKAMLDVTSRHWAAAQSAAQNPKGGSGDAPWKALGESLVKALNTLTGKSHPGAAEWLEAYKGSKKKLGALFAKPLS